MHSSYILSFFTIQSCPIWNLALRQLSIPSLTLHCWHSSPHIDGPLAAELANGALQEKERDTNDKQHDGVRDEEGTW